MNKKLFSLYKKLFKTFGYRGWWPVTIKSGFPPEYRPGFYSKPSKKEAFEISISAVLTQNTSWENVKKSLIKLSAEGLLEPSKFGSIKLEKLMKLIKSSGYYKQKSERLVNLCSWFVDNWEKSKYLSTDSLRNSLLSLKGIGPETADSIVLYAFNRPSFVIDSYTKRIISRIFNEREKEYYELKKEFEGSLPEETSLYNEFHALLVELGKKFCKKNSPICSECPVLIDCFYGRKYANKRKDIQTTGRRKN